MTTKEHLLEVAEREFATTLKVIRAFPGDRLDFKPHEVSRSAADLLMVFLADLDLIEQIVGGKMVMSDLEIHKYSTLLEYSDKFQLIASQAVSKINSLSDEGLQETIQVFGRTQTKLDAIWLMILDQIHHRGQFSVYIRMAGGKVPQIYGPYADEPGLPKPE
jgi:uncharacterized damage-inducible protein DinB